MAETSVEYKLVVLGEDGIGKSALVIRLCTTDFCADYDPTIEDAYRKVLNIDDCPCLLDVLDTVDKLGDEDCYSALKDQYTRSGQGFLLCFDLTNRRSFEAISLFRDHVNKVKDADNVPMILVGLKHDLVDKRQVSNKEASALAKTFGIYYFEVSALTEHNVIEAFSEAVRQIKKCGPYPASTFVKTAKMMHHSSGRCLMY